MKVLEGPGHVLERLGLGEVLEKAMKEGAGRARTCAGKTRAG
tara:strand:- start:486 stop:611 length:126 start_codon:yes stop_codon:yes gene_type:complete